MRWSTTLFGIDYEVEAEAVYEARKKTAEMYLKQSKQKDLKVSYLIGSVPIMVIYVLFLQFLVKD